MPHTRMPNTDAATDAHQRFDCVLVISRRRGVRNTIVRPLDDTTALTATMFAGAGRVVTRDSIRRSGTRRIDADQGCVRARQASPAGHAGAVGLRSERHPCPRRGRQRRVLRDSDRAAPVHGRARPRVRFAGRPPCWARGSGRHRLGSRHGGPDGVGPHQCRPQGPTGRASQRSRSRRSGVSTSRTTRAGPGSMATSRSRSILLRCAGRSRGGTVTRLTAATPLRFMPSACRPKKTLGG
jgi:hypothetical protein